MLLTTCITATDAMLGILMRMRLPFYRSNECMQTAERCHRVCETVEACSRDREVVATREDLKRCR
jgi:hypothetical protein